MDVNIIDLAGPKIKKGCLYSYYIDGIGNIYDSNDSLFPIKDQRHFNNLFDILPTSLCAVLSDSIRQLKDENRVIIRGIALNAGGVSIPIHTIFRKSLKKPGLFLVKGFVSSSNVEHDNIFLTLTQLPFPACVIASTGCLKGANNLFWDYFEVVNAGSDLNIQDVLITNDFSPERFSVSILSSQDSFDHAVFCRTSSSGVNQTFVLSSTCLSALKSKDVRYILVFKDITSFIEIQYSLEQKNSVLKEIVKKEMEQRMAHEINILHKSRLETLGEIASGMIHELNQPLAHLSLMLDNVVERCKEHSLSTEYLIEKTEVIQNQIFRIRDIVSGIKEFATGNISLKKQHVDVRSIVNDCLGESSIVVPNLVIKVNQPCDCFFYSYRGKLEQILSNILTNSFQSLLLKQEAGFVFKPRVLITVEKTQDFVKVVVADNGIGIMDRDKSKIFKPFYTTKKDIGGTGLGLFIINNLMREMKGNIEIKSQYLNYCVVNLRFPIRKE
ncbi:sensor histidine kinase [Marinilabiliaceae bacterium JC017]|nr:sensor histidine kinase [Marinilabiliaceae bacterium JC017]